MWIVKIALLRPYTFVVMSLLIVLLGGLAVFRMPTDIFPDINIPVASVIWNYNGISAEEMAEVVTTRSERSFTTNVNDIEHIESQSLAGLSIIKLFFHPNAKIEAAVAQIAAGSQGTLRSLPPGFYPPAILRFNASSVPILQLSASSDVLSEQEVYDFGYNFIRTQMATVQGTSIPLPYGGRPRQVMVDIDPRSLAAYGMSAADVSNALNNQSMILPSGTAKIGSAEFNVRLNSAPELVKAFNDLPLKTVNGATIYVRDVAQVRDGYAVQQNVVRLNGRRATTLTILKNGGASTLDIVGKIKALLPRITSTLPPNLNLKLLFDQSIFVRAAIEGVLKEAVTAAFLTGLMILLFLGSWRSTLIVCISIPLSILTSLAILYLMHETINVMTLGGLALAVGILVDDATVEIENIHRNLGLGKPIIPAILDGAQQIAVPAFVSTLCICIVFLPVVFLTGAAGYLFTPLALAVVLAMAASYLLSRTLVPTMCHYLLPAEIDRYRGPEGESESEPKGAGIIWHAHHEFHRLFEKLRDRYTVLLESGLAHRKLVAALFGLMCLACGALGPFIGTDFFPIVDAGQIRLHVRAPGGTRIEETERYFTRVEDVIRTVIPPAELSDIMDNIGLPYSGLNVATSDSGILGSFDGEILVSLKAGEHGPTWDYVKQLRRRLGRELPELTFFFQPADIVGQILNFGLPAPVDVQIAGPLKNSAANYKIAKQLERRIAQVPGAVDVHLHQVVDVPELRVNVDHTRARQLGLTQRDVANSMLISLSSSGAVSSNWWINPSNNVDYLVAVQTPQHMIDSTDALMSTPLNGGGRTQLLNNIASVERGSTTSVVNHYNVQPLFNVYANVQGADLGSLSSAVSKIVKEFEPKLAKGSFFEIRGQVETMRSSFVGLGVGIVFAILLVYFVMVVNFQSWLDPFIILMALPGALAGILLTLFVTQTTINVPSLMGAIMSIGVATANSILLVNFANDLRREGYDSTRAALIAARTRLRPVVMTAAAMIMGMLPMALGFGEGGEQNSPLGRAVIGGLLLATVATLFFVPIVYSVLRKQAPRDFDSAEIANYQ